MILDFAGTKISDISVLSELKQLRNIDMSGSFVADIKPLSNLQFLTDLNMDETQVRDLAPIAGLTSLVRAAQGRYGAASGVSFRGCPITDPDVAALGALRNPGRTIQLFELLKRGQSSTSS